jgi:hypothetical protein
MHNGPCGLRVKERTPIDEPIVVKYQANEIHDSRPFKVLMKSYHHDPCDCLLCDRTYKPHGDLAEVGSETSVLLYRRVVHEQT